MTVALGSEVSVRLRTRELCEDPRALATAASLLCWLMRCSKLPAAPLAEVGVVLNHGREEISCRLLCCFSSQANCGREKYIYIF